uniref:G-protein coupled receptors family 1 profile domain-containing protein n=1 Tax=Magallana gigas TaxID=29159 RepID=K1Q4S0_MAGGI|eukprot:XP_011439621.1 PREDICTED: uncharacterized protein LOC105336844 [Crassostrea gigas]
MEAVNSTRMSMDNSTQKLMGNVTERTQSVLQDGYDLPVYGLDTGWFLYIHVPALCCIFLSLFCASAVIIASFRSQTRPFFSWMRSERFVVYLSMCDALFNVTHSMDHLQMVITKDHVYPEELCEFYSFFIGEFVSAQLLMTNVAAINAFGLIYLQKQFKLGKYDWKLLLYTFGVPFVLSVCAVNFGYYGPSGSYCYFDGVKGAFANIFFTTVPMTVVLVINVVLYVMTWWKIHTESKRIKTMLGNEAQTIRASHKAAKLMSLFVTAFFVQWWALGIISVWQNFAVVPQQFFTVVVMFTNLGGVLNGIVYIIIKRRRDRNYSSKPLKSSSQMSADSGISNSTTNVSVIDTQV